MKKIIFFFFLLFVYVLNVKGISGTIIINRYDNENKDRLEATLVGSKIAVYKNNGLIAELTIDENGTAKLEGLELGMYTINERNDITGYNISPYTHTVYITEYESTKVVSWGSSVIEGNFIINKYYGEEGDYKLDESAVFEVYHNNKLIKILEPINGVIKEKLEYGTYTIRQVSGIKYYDLSEEFTVKIDNNKDYKYDLYTNMYEDLNNFISSKEEELLSKENELNNLEELLNQEKNSLISLRNELLEKEEKINKEWEDLKQNKEKLEKQKEEINSDYLNISIKIEELIIKEQELNKLKNNLNIFNVSLDEKELSLIEIEADIKKRREELDLLNDKLNGREQELINLEKNIKIKELELKNREDNIIKQQNKITKEDVLVVEVPNTYKKNYNKLVSKFMIVIGIILIILSKRKVTNH